MQSPQQNFFARFLSRRAKKRLARQERRELAAGRAGLVHYPLHIAHIAPPTDILELCQKHGADKGATDVAAHPCGGAAGRDYVHNYAPFYDFLFAARRLQIKNVLECGVGSLRPESSMHAFADSGYKPGASLRMWRDYFPRAHIVGLDCDAGALFAEERIATYCVDQTCANSVRKFKAECAGRFDVIIDDGLHVPNAGIAFFNEIIDRLADDGTYIIEDVRAAHQAAYVEFFAAPKQQKKYCARFVTLPPAALPGHTHPGNSLAVISKIADADAAAAK